MKTWPLAQKPDIETIMPRMHRRVEPLQSAAIMRVGRILVPSAFKKKVEIALKFGPVKADKA